MATHTVGEQSRRTSESLTVLIIATTQHAELIFLTKSANTELYFRLPGTVSPRERAYTPVGLYTQIHQMLSSMEQIQTPVLKTRQSKRTGSSNFPDEYPQTDGS